MWRLCVTAFRRPTKSRRTTGSAYFFCVVRVLLFGVAKRGSVQGEGGGADTCWLLCTHAISIYIGSETHQPFLGRSGGIPFLVFAVLPLPLLPQQPQPSRLHTQSNQHILVILKLTAIAHKPLLPL